MMLGPKLYSKSLLKNYILRRLGSPVVNIELTDDQLEDCINDTIDPFVMTAYSGIQERYIPITFAPDIKEYILPYNVFAVLGVYSSGMGFIGGGTPSSNPFHINNYIASDIFKGRGIVNLIQYELTFEMIATLNLLLGKSVIFDYNTFTKALHIISDDAVAGSGQALIHVYKTIAPTEGEIPNPYYIEGTDPTSAAYITGETTNIYDHVWVRKMSVERARYQWATNMMKYAGSVLPNGGQLNVDGILNEAKENIQKLSEELDMNYQLPPDFMIG